MSRKRRSILEKYLVHCMDGAMDANTIFCSCSIGSAPESSCRGERGPSSYLRIWPGSRHCCRVHVPFVSVVDIFVVVVVVDVILIIFVAVDESSLKYFTPLVLLQVEERPWRKISSESPDGFIS